MTADERLEQLLNRAGQTISDLPKSFAGGPEAYSGADCYKAHGSAWAWYLGEELQAVPELEQHESTRDRLILRQYILHLTDVIDRLEWALDNVTMERDWLKEMNRLQAACQTCAHHADGDPLQCADGKRLCKLGDDGACLSWKYCGVPEDWRADDA